MYSKKASNDTNLLSNILSVWNAWRGRIAMLFFLVCLPWLKPWLLALVLLVAFVVVTLLYLCDLLANRLSDQREHNASVQRQVQKYGWQRYLKKINAEVINQNNYGTLYQKQFFRGDPLVVLEVLNATPEPDGSYMHYYLRVPPDVTTPREAVAWTFGMERKVYSPRRQT